MASSGFCCRDRSKLTSSTFEDDAGAYNQKDAHGFIRLNALRMRIAANRAANRAGKKKG